MAQPKGEKASERARRLLIERMLNGAYPPGSALPGERDLAKELGVARPALREALQGLSGDGWLSIQQGKPTQVSHFMRDGNLNVLIGLLQVDISHLPDFVPNLLEMWGLLAPTYTHRAIDGDAPAIYRQLYGYRGLADRPHPYMRAQWRLHRRLIELGGNPVYGLVLNSFSDFYSRLAVYYFVDPGHRAETADFWAALYHAALAGDAARGAGLMGSHMRSIYTRWTALDISDWIEGSVEILDEGEGHDRV